MRTHAIPCGAPGGKQLPQTSWTLLAAARDQGTDGQGAREEFAFRYYRPVHAYLQAIVRDDEEAKDLAQGFFTDVIVSGRLLNLYDRAHGSFRPVLEAGPPKLCHERIARARTCKASPAGRRSSAGPVELGMGRSRPGGPGGARSRVSRSVGAGHASAGSRTSERDLRSETPERAPCIVSGPLSQ